MTLCNVLILHQQSGLVLFAKDFVKNAVAQPRLLGSLLTAQTEFSEKCTGMKPTFIEMSSLAVTLVHDEAVRLLCALVHDRNDSAPFGRLIASEILAAFVDEFNADRLKTPAGLGRDLKDFNSFDGKINGIVQNSVRPVLRELQSERGVVQAVLVTEEQVVQAGGPEVEQFSLYANMHYMLPYADHLLDVACDGVREVYCDDVEKDTRTFLWRIERGSVLIVCLSTALGAAVYANALDQTRLSKSIIGQVVHFAQASYRPHRRRGSKKDKASRDGAANLLNTALRARKTAQHQARSAAAASSSEEAKKEEDLPAAAPAGESSGVRCGAANNRSSPAAAPPARSPPPPGGDDDDDADEEKKTT
mmetsp:Transcript_26797/g.82260  ORF Transcript_26797/g.82260 Transcript_26797/m.82260 type:complete len:362 (+) Transcript_26797:1659-2744(+)